jgi:hypothetical protein
VLFASGDMRAVGNYEVIKTLVLDTPDSHVISRELLLFTAAFFPQLQL